MLKRVLEKIKPSKEEISKMRNLSKEVADNIKIKDAVVVLGGSAAKDTWLKDSHDVDLYVKFNYQKYKDKNISSILENALKKKFKIKKLHGSRNYFQIKKSNLVFEIVPILDIKKASEAKNITDISPLHAKWVKKSRAEDEIRLTKAFAKAQNVYGAETHMRGFSGYVLEILTIYYNGFLKLVKAASNWKDKKIIDPENLLKNPLKELNKSKINSPLVLIDPVDKTRNAAASLSKENYNKFIIACGQFLKNPSEDFFVKKEEKIPKGVLVLEFDFKKGKEDVIGGKFFSLFNKLQKQLNLNEFKVVKSNFVFGEKAVFWYKMKNKELPKKVEVRGPPINLEQHVKEFKKKHKTTIIKNGIIYSMENRKYIKAEDLLKNLLKGMKFKVRWQK